MPILQDHFHNTIGRALTLFALALPQASSAETAGNIVSRHLTVKDVDFHYLEAGQGEALLVLHGYTETSHMWRPLMSKLGQRFRVIAPDLPGIGDSSIPAAGLDMMSAATRVHDLLAALHVERARVVGHDIGMMVAYAYAARYRDEVPQLVAMDARLLPGVGNWEATYHDPALWHYFFNGPTAEALVKGRERLYFEHFWNDFAAERTRSLSAADRSLYARSYARDGRMRAGWAYFSAFPQTAREFSQLGQTKLAMPVLVVTGQKAGGTALAQQFRLVASNVSELVLPDTGHFVVDERPREVEQALLDFLNSNADTKR